MFVNFFISAIKKAGPEMFLSYEKFGLLERFCYFIGPHDWLLMGLGILLSRTFSKIPNKILKAFSRILLLFLFLYLVPLFSAVFETQRYLYIKKANGGFVDGFELLYVHFKFPIYWLIILFILLTGKESLGSRFRKLLNINE
jgi:hypothetical protein